MDWIVAIAIFGCGMAMGCALMCIPLARMNKLAAAGVKLAEDATDVWAYLSPKKQGSCVKAARMLDEATGRFFEGAGE